MIQPLWDNDTSLRRREAFLQAGYTSELVEQTLPRIQRLVEDGYLVQQATHHVLP